MQPLSRGNKQSHIVNTELNREFVISTQVGKGGIYDLGSAIREATF